MRNLIILILFTASFSAAFSQKDTTIKTTIGVVTLPEVLVRNKFDYQKLLQQIKNDTSFYKAFRNLRVLGFTSFNDIKMLNKKDEVIASLYSKTKQIRDSGCRSTQVLEETTTGNFYNDKKGFNYTTPEMYAALFWSKGKICGEDNIVSNKSLSAIDKKGMDKHKEQLKMLFFNPGKKIPGIPFIGNKLDLYDEHAHKIYDYKIEIEDLHGQLCYVFSITPKEDRKTDAVVDNMVTWFDIKTLEVLARNYSLSYKAGIYDFDVSMEVEMQKFKGLTVPRVLRYKGNWNVIFKKREKAVFTATLFDFE